MSSAQKAQSCAIVCVPRVQLMVEDAAPAYKIASHMLLLSAAPFAAAEEASWRSIADEHIAALPISKLQASEYKYDRFHAEFVVKNTPVVIRGGGLSWPCVSKWSKLEFWRRQQLWVTPEFYGFTHEQNFCLGMKDLKAMPMKQYLSTLPMGEYMLNEEDFITRGEFHPLGEALRDDFPFPVFHALADHRRTTLFLVNSSYSQMHYHGDTEAVITQISGSKHVFLAPPSLSEVIRHGDASSPFTACEDICHFGESHKQRGVSPQVLRHPDARWVRLQPGDQLYFPWLWWHAAWGTPSELSVAFTHFWDVPQERLHALKTHQAGHRLQRECDEKGQELPDLSASVATAAASATAAATTAATAATTAATAAAAAAAKIAFGAACEEPRDEAHPVLPCHALSSGRKWQCRASELGQLRVEYNATRVDTVFSCPVNARSALAGRKSASGATPSLPMTIVPGAGDGNQPLALFCEMQSACAALQASSGQAERLSAHVQVADLLMEKTDTCQSSRLDQPEWPCDWNCLSRVDLRHALAHSKAAQELAQAMLDRGDRDATILAAVKAAERVMGLVARILPDDAQEGALAPSDAATDTPATPAQLLDRTRAALASLDALPALDPPAAVRMEQVAPAVRVGLHRGRAQVGLYRIEQLLTRDTPSGGWTGFNQRLAAATNAGLARTCGDRDTNGTELNFDYFNTQDELFAQQTSERACHIGTALDELRDLPDFLALRDALVAAGTDFEQRFDGEADQGDGEDVQSARLAPCGAVRDSSTRTARAYNGLAVSASSKRHGADHPWHVHQVASVTGVYYASTPQGSADIYFDDGHEQVVLSPEPGDLIVFPSWLPHRVAENAFASDATTGASEEHLTSSRRESRVSFSFDLHGGTWGVGREHW